MGLIGFTWSFLDVFIVGPLARLAGLLFGAESGSRDEDRVDHRSNDSNAPRPARDERGHGRARPPSNRTGWWRGNRDHR